MKYYMLPAISACLLVLIILAVPGKDSFRYSAGEIMEDFSEHGHFIGMERLEALQDEIELILVDVSNGENVPDHALPGSVRFPAESLDVRSIPEFFSGSDTYVLYADKVSQATEVWILLTQMGVENLLVLDAGSD